MSHHPFLTPAQAAELLGIATGKVLGWIQSGELSAVDVSAARGQRPRWRIDPAEWDRFINARRSSPPPKLSKPRKLRGTVTKFIQ